MKRLVKYIFFILCFLTGCQTPELIEIPSFTPGEGVYGEATISFSVSIPRTKVETKAMGDQLSADLKNLYLIVFDENGYFVESRKAEYDEENIDNAIEAENAFTVTLNLTDKKRIIHFIANCPEGQIRYGHENEVISSMYVTKDAVMETSYWHRLLVDNILTDGDGNLVGETANKFKKVPMLRNYAMITVEDNDQDDNFELLRFGVYNTIDRGTVAPYNKSTQTFQPFISGENVYSYDDLVGLGFEGHALIDAQLDGTFTAGDFLDEGGSYFMYERRIDNTITGSNEAPTHIILEGEFDGGQPTYYKVDLIERINNTTKFYHILRNFEYTFKLKSVTGPGYATIQEAMSKPASNNLAGSVETQKLTSVSDGTGRIYVSFTEITLVSNEDVKLRFKYIPDIETGTIDNTQVDFDGIFDGTGAVIKQVKSIVYNAGDGWGEVTFKIQNPTDVDRTQQIELLAGANLNLHKTISFRLRNPYLMNVICYDSANSNSEGGDNIVETGIGKSVGVEIRLPDNLSSDMFPLDLLIEADKLSISPDANRNGNVRLPVETGTSIIPGKNTQSFHYVLSIESLDLFKQLESLGEGMSKQRVIRTHWLTNIVNSASYVIVDNKYFNVGESFFINSAGQVLKDPLGVRFYDMKFDRVRYGADQPVEFQFKMTTATPVTVTLSGLAYNGETTFTYTPQSPGYQTLDLVTTENSGGVSVTLAAEGYETVTSSATHDPQPHFSDLKFDKEQLGTADDEPVTFSFTLSDYEPDMKVKVALNGLVPADDMPTSGPGSLVQSATRAAVNYIYTPTGANCTLKLKTASAGANTCSVQLSAEEYNYLSSEPATINQANAIKIQSLNIEFSTGKTDLKPNDANKMKLSVNGNGIISAGYSVSLSQTSTGWGSNKRYTLSGSIIGLEFIDCTDDTLVTFSITQGKNTYTASTTLRNLKDGSETLNFGF